MLENTQNIYKQNIKKKVRKWQHKILKEPHIAITKQTQNYRVPILVIIFLKIHKENIKWFFKIFFIPFFLLGQIPFEVFIDVVYFKHFIV